MGNEDLFLQVLCMKNPNILSEDVIKQNKEHYDICKKNPSIVIQQALEISELTADLLSMYFVIKGKHKSIEALCLIIYNRYIYQSEDFKVEMVKCCVNLKKDFDSRNNYPDNLTNEAMKLPFCWISVLILHEIFNYEFRDIPLSYNDTGDFFIIYSNAFVRYFKDFSKILNQ
jgi:hypothetical protein